MGARQRDALRAVPRAQQAHIGTTRDELLDQLHVCPVVFYIQQGAQRCAMLNMRLNRRKRFGCADGRLRFSRHIQFDPEHAALPDRAFHADFATHQFDQPLAHHQADAGAFLGAGLLSETIERLEKLREFFGRQSFTGILHADAYALRGARAARHFDRSLRAVVFDRVGKQVDQNLLHPGSVGMNKVRGFEPGKTHADAAFLRLWFDHGLAFEHDVDQRHGFQRQRQLARLDQREIENLVDQLQQIPSRLENLVDTGLLSWRRQRRTRFH